MTVLIDNRLGSKDLITYPPLNTIGELIHLDSADICFTGNGPDGPAVIGIELKTVEELISSTVSGRIQGRQIVDMLESYDISWLLYYGRIRPTKDGYLEIWREKKGKRREGWYRLKLYGNKQDVPYGYLKKFLFTLTAAGIRFDHVENKKEAAEWIGCLYRWWSKKWEDHKSLKSFDNSRAIAFMPKVSKSQRERAIVANSLPVRIGHKKAIAAGKHFQSIEDMINASVEQWEEVDGIGKVLARSTVAAIHRQEK